MIPYIALLLLSLTIVQFYYNWRVQPVSVYLSLALLMIGVMSLTHYFFCYGSSRFWLAVFFNHFTPFYLLLGPMLYFYVRGTLNDSPGLSLRDGWHFLPFLAALAMILPYVFQPWDYKLGVAEALMRDFRSLPELPQWVTYPSWVNYVLRNLSSIGYTACCLSMVLRFERHYPGRHRIPQWEARYSIRFLKLLLFVCLGAELIFTILYGMYYRDDTLTAIQLVSNPLMSILVVGLSAIPMAMVFSPEVLYGIPRLARVAGYVEAEPVGSDPSPVEGETAPAEALSPTPEAVDRFRGLAEAIHRVMEERKPYLDPDFSIDSLAQIMGVPKHHLYYCFNSILNTRFTRVRAEYRVKHVQQLIREGLTDIKTLEAIGIESGFSSSASFRAVFKEVTGMSPREYQQSLG